MSSYEQMSDEDLRVKMAEVMGWKSLETATEGGLIGIPPRLLPTATLKEDVPDPIHNANDLREVRLFAWEKYKRTCTVVMHEDHCCVEVWDHDDSRLMALVNADHDATRDGIIRAEGRATVIAVLKAIDAAQPQERAS